MQTTMKRKLRFLLLPLIGTAAIAGCDELLEEDPRGLLGPDQFFNQPAEAEQAVLGIYSHLFDQESFGRDFGLLGDWATDLFHSATRIAEGWQWYLTYTLDANSVQDIVDNWRSYYRAVGDANLAISRISAMENIKPAEKARLVGEAKFMRALYYYYLTNLWGDVPMWLDELELDKVRDMPRTPVAEVRAQIIRDLQDAEKALPSTYEASGQGRATRWAAKALMVKTYMQMHDWKNARDKAREIVDSSPHSLLNSHCAVFDHDNEFNDEIIFTVNFVENLRQTSRSNRFTPRRQDERKASRQPGVRLGGFGWYTLYPQFAQQFTKQDARRACSVATEIKGVKLNWIYMPKFWDISSPRPNRGYNFIVFRLADVHLLLAEAENELNGPAQAYAPINRIRARAGLEPLSGLTKEQFRTALMKERALELGGEGHRRWDLVRWGKLVEAVRSIKNFPLNPFAAQNVQPHHVRFPIPQEEIQKNPNLKQNPGY
jgi:hypothetical protein